MANYFIGIDENGQPFIAHASAVDTATMQGGNKIRWRDRASARAKKYLQKVQDYYGKGKSLYLYTNDQVRAFANRGKRKVADAIGLTAKRRRDTALNKLNKGGLSEAGQKAYRNAANVNQEAYSKSLLGRADYAINKTRFKAKALKNRAVDKARDIYGYDERDRWQQARKNYESAIGTPAEEALRIEMNRTLNEYGKTAMGRREARRAKRAIRKATKK